MISKKHRRCNYKIWKKTVTCPRCNGKMIKHYGNNVLTQHRVVNDGGLYEWWCGCGQVLQGGTDHSTEELRLLWSWQEANGLRENNAINNSAI